MRGPTALKNPEFMEMLVSVSHIRKSKSIRRNKCRIILRSFPVIHFTIFTIIMAPNRKQRHKCMFFPCFSGFESRWDNIHASEKLCNIHRQFMGDP